MVCRPRTAEFNPGTEPLHVGHSGPHRFVRRAGFAGAGYLREFLEGRDERDVYQLVSLAMPPVDGQVAVQPVTVGVAMPSKGLGQFESWLGWSDGCAKGPG